MKITGIPVCPGKVLCKTRVLRPVPQFNLERKTTCSIEETRHQVFLAISQISKQLGKTAQKLSEHEAELIEVQRTMLQEDCFLEEVEHYISQGYAPEAVVLKAAKTQEDLLLATGDAYMSARAEDMRDASYRIACLITGDSYPNISSLEEPVILITEELLPTMLISADLQNLCGIIMQKGTRTSHVSILASSFNIPTLVNCPEAMQLPDGEMIFLNSEKGEVTYGLETYEEQQRQADTYKEEKQQLQNYCNQSAISADGQPIVTLANIVEPIVLDQVNKYGLDGVGLFRTEFLYMNRTAPPTEEEQLAIYRMAAQKLGNKPLTIRTMDIGGDKEVDYLGLPDEQNPFMGFRAIRICLSRTQLFKTQLRAVLRASAVGNIRVMFPMIATKAELLQALELLEQCRQELAVENIPYQPEMPVGIMVEVPSAAILLDKMAKDIQFVSIGSNDLLQYTYAADRLNPNVAYLYNFMDPAVLRLISHTVQICRQMRLECSLCGEMAGDAIGLAALSALGLRKFSVSPSLGLITKKRIRLLDLASLEEAGAKMLQSDTAQQAARVLCQALPAEYLAFSQ